MRIPRKEAQAASKKREEDSETDVVAIRKTKAQAGTGAGSADEVAISEQKVESDADVDMTPVKQKGTRADDNHMLSSEKVTVKEARAVSADEGKADDDAELSEPDDDGDGLAEHLERVMEEDDA